MTQISGDQIINAVSGTVVRGSAASIAVSRLSEPADAAPEAVAFLISTSYVKDIASTRASVLVVQASLWESVSSTVPDTVKLVLTAADAYLGLARLTELYASLDPLAEWRFDGLSALIDPTAEIDPSAKVAAGAVVCAQAKIGPRTIVFPHCTVGPAARIGEDCVLFPGVVLYPRTMLGNRVRLHANAVIGADGFGYARGPSGSVKIWHLGRVIIGNDVEVGAGTCIDRGTLKDTIIEDGVKIDNLVQVGHNGHLKAHAVVCAQTGLAGNVTVGRGAILAGQAGVGDKVEIGDGAIVGPQSGASKDVPAGVTILSILSARPRKQWWRLNAYFDRLPDLYERVKKLEGGHK